MTKTCRKCKNEIPELEFLPEGSKLELLGLIYQDLKLFAAKTLMDHGLSHKEAKIVVDHLNKKFGECIRCDYATLEKEEMDCPKCGAFNFNLKTPVFNQDFCSLLEYSLPFHQIENESVRNFWCDGIDPIPYDMKSLAIDKLRANGKIRTRAWTGVSGQEIYEMTIHFGTKSISHLEQGLSLEQCIYTENANDWIKVNPSEKTIEIKLK